ncbi:MAG: mismatch-specific DNA-glycosylase [Saprospiraceae bacterium]|nr:mismatch-specific DNA-glycosylase [Saprospiraceae bacterium]
MILPDLLAPELTIVFCGTAAGTKSAERMAYYAGPGNQFYPTLARFGFTPRLLKPAEFRELLNYGIGLTDLVKHYAGQDKSLKQEYFDTESFEQKIQNFAPKMVCFNGKEAARVYFGLKNTGQLKFGLQEKTIGNTKLFVAPSTSALAKSHWDESVWQNLKLNIF